MAGIDGRQLRGRIGHTHYVYGWHIRIYIRNLAKDLHFSFIVFARSAVEDKWKGGSITLLELQNTHTTHPQDSRMIYIWIYKIVQIIVFWNSKVHNSSLFG
jgi:hypothetical protein